MPVRSKRSWPIPSSDDSRSSSEHPVARTALSRGSSRSSARFGTALLNKFRPRYWLGKIICGVIFREGLSNTGASAEPSSGAPPLTRMCGGHTVEPSFAHREHGSWFVIWHSLDDREQR
jgi:hypothetical protein